MSIPSIASATAGPGRVVIYQESTKVLLSLAQRAFADPGPSSPTAFHWAESLHAYVNTLASWDRDIVTSLIHCREIENGLIALYRACPFLTIYEREQEWRPDMIETVNAVIEVVSAKSSIKALLDLAREDAMGVIDLLYEVVDNQTRLAIAPRLANRVSDMLRRMCAKYVWLPGACIVPAGRLTLLGDTAVDCGGYSDVWRATYHARDRSTTVALKVFRVYAKDKLKRVRKKFCEEAILWLRLRHKNIVPLLGADMTLFPVCLVSVWMKYGNISGYLRKHPDEDRLRLLIDVAEGLAYLHSESMVHGDLKCANILINDERQACIGDFGLSAVIHDPDTIMSITPSPNALGTLRWTAPEILDPERFGLEHAVASPETDVYSFGMVMWETFSGHTPYDEYRYDATAQWKILSGVRPERPSHATMIGLSDLVWDLIQRCWLADRHRRPTADTIVHELQGARQLSQLSFARQMTEHAEPGHVPANASLLTRLRMTSVRRRRKASSLTSARTLTPPGIVHNKGEPAVASIASTSVQAVFTRASSTSDAEWSRVPTASRLRAEASERTLVDVAAGSREPVKTGESPLLPLLTANLTAPIPFVRSPVSISLPPIDCPTPQLTWSSIRLPPRVGVVDSRHGSSAPETEISQHFTGPQYEPGPSKDIRALEMQRELSGNRNNSWVHDWGYTAGGW